METNKVMERVRKLIAKAEHPNTDPTEAQSYRRMADKIMLDYSIEEAMVRDAMPAQERTKPEIIEVAGGPEGQDFDTLYVETLMGYVASHCRCKVRDYVRYDSEERVWMSKVYGFSADLRYFEVLYTTLRLHMLGVMVSRWDPTKTDGQNAYDLHNAGYNWLQIGEMRGYKPYFKGSTVWYTPDGDETDKFKVAGPIKRAYMAECKLRGEEPKKVPAGGTETWRKDAARGYVGRIHERLQEVAGQRNTNGQELVLANVATDLRDFFREDAEHLYTRCPRCGKLSVNPYNCEFCGQFLKDKPEPPKPCEKCAKSKSGACRDHPWGSFRRESHNPAAYAAGVAHANRADISASGKVGTQHKEVTS